MFWLITQMWVLLLIAFGAGLLAGAWAFSGVGVRKDRSPGGRASASAPLNLLSAPFGDKDDLTQIIGVDQATQNRLNGMGVFHLEQIANWDVGAARWIEAQLNEPDRVTRERWTEQAQSLR